MTDPMGEAIGQRTPRQMTKRHAEPDLVAFDVSPWLKQGANDIEVELIRTPKIFDMPASRRLAVDAGILRNGQLEA